MLDSGFIAHYELLEKLGEGGMGVVYKARDTRLDRLVAIKVLLPEKVTDPDRKRRFIQEAKAASALNHPNIVTIYDVDHAEGVDLIAMEYVDGRTLDQVIGRRGMKLDDALKYATQIASALGAAHAAGIVHRDLKPNNVMVTGAGVAKVLDFGLAKLTELTLKTREELETRTFLNAETLKTIEGFVVGTAAYMSPEQAEGKPVDARCDIFAFGALLYEAVTGQPAFLRDSRMSTLAAVLREDPKPPSEVTAGTPPELERIIARCLRKDPDRRYHHMADVRLALEEVRDEASSPAANAALSPVARFPYKAAVAALAALILFAVWLVRQNARPVQVRWSFTQITDQPGPEFFPSLSPDGKTVVYAARASGSWDIFAQRVGGKNATNLTRNSAADETQPAFSPDGERIAFRSERDGGGIFIMGATGEALRRITAFGYNPAWSPDSTRIVVATESIARPEDRFVPVSRLWIVNLSTQQTRLLSNHDGVQPHWSPRGYRIAYWASRAGQRDIWTISADGGEPAPVTQDTHVDWNPVWSPDGRYLYFLSDRGGPMNLWRVPVDEHSGEVLGEIEPVTTPSSDTGQISISRSGHIAYAHQVSTARLHRAAFDPVAGKVNGRSVDITGGARQAVRPDLSPDGAWLAFCSWGRLQNILLVRTDGTDLRQLTDDPYFDRGPRWSPDQSQIAFFSNRSGRNEIWVVRPDGSGLRQVSNVASNAVWPVWSPDGKRMVYTAFGAGRSSFLVEDVSQAAEQTPRQLPAPGAKEAFNAWHWSPDGEKLSGFLQHEDGGFTGIAAYSLKTGAYTRLTSFGLDPVWLSDSRRLLFTHKGRIWLAGPDNGEAREVLSAAPSEVAPRGFAISRDDRAIYFSLAATESDIWLAQSN
ncbi:MAG: PD40 domain-containing protein [Bryobacteraceae bacterium]|nr:PD40 domain-containing protein [Bryobacteraceae bacterium]